MPSVIEGGVCCYACPDRYEELTWQDQCKLWYVEDLHCYRNLLSSVQAARPGKHDLYNILHLRMITVCFRAISAIEIAGIGVSRFRERFFSDMYTSMISDTAQCLQSSQWDSMVMALRVKCCFWQQFHGRQCHLSMTECH